MFSNTPRKLNVQKNNPTLNPYFFSPCFLIPHSNKACLSAPKLTSICAFSATSWCSYVKNLGLRRSLKWSNPCTHPATKIPQRYLWDLDQITVRFWVSFFLTPPSPATHTQNQGRGCRFDLYYSKHGPRTSNTGNTLELSEMQNLRLHPRLLNWDLHFNKMFRWFMRILKSEKWWGNLKNVFLPVTYHLCFLVEGWFYYISFFLWEKTYYWWCIEAGKFFPEPLPSNSHFSLHVVMPLKQTFLPLQFCFCPYNEEPLSVSFVCMISSSWGILLAGQQRTNHITPSEDSTLGW